MKTLILSSILFFSSLCFAFPNTDLNFSCEDSFNQTSSKFELRRSNQDYTWLANHEEVDVDTGITVLIYNNLNATIDDQNRLVLNLNKKVYGLFILTNLGEAQYQDGKRIMNCTFN